MSESEIIQCVIVIMGTIGIYMIITFDIIFLRDFDISFLNPIRNYKEWCYTLNWFGIGIMTVFLNIIFLPYAIIYWLVKLIYFLITVGRKEK